MHWAGQYDTSIHDTVFLQYELMLIFLGAIRNDMNRVLEYNDNSADQYIRIFVSRDRLMVDPPSSRLPLLIPSTSLSCLQSWEQHQSRFASCHFCIDDISPSSTMHCIPSIFLSTTVDHYIIVKIFFDKKLGTFNYDWAGSNHDKEAKP